MVSIPSNVSPMPPRPPRADDGWLYDTQLFVPDPWADDAFADLAPDAPVVMLGTGLTMVDAAISLLDRGHRGPIHALSRRGLCPQRHLPVVRAPIASTTSIVISPTDSARLSFLPPRSSRHTYSP